MPLIRIRPVAVFAVAALVASCGGGSTAPMKPANITVSATGTITGTIGTAVTPVPTFRVLDDKGAAIANVTVTIAIGSGSGTITGAPKASGSGEVPVGSWVLGATPGINTLTITVAGLAPVVISANARPAYFVDVRFFGSPVDAAFQASFAIAKARIEAMIVGDMPDVSANALNVATDCDAVGVAPLTEIIDDIIIFVTVKEIDGVGKVLGSTFQCYQRATGGLALISIMTFDVADLQTLRNDGRIGDTILHEMLHSVGFGNLWLSKGQVAGFGGPAPGFVGAQAVAACQSLGGGSNCAQTVPLEVCGGGGTRDVHWREPTICAGNPSLGFGFKTELMTGFISAVGIGNPLSRMTIASLADLGYQVNQSVADAYTVPSGTSAVALSQIREAQGMGGFEINEILRGPIGTVDDHGRVTLNSARRK